MNYFLNRPIVESDKIDTPNTQIYIYIYNCSLSWLGTGTLLKSNVIKIQKCSFMGLPSWSHDVVMQVFYGTPLLVT